MAKELDRKETVSMAEALRMEVLINQALVELLIAKGILTEEEVIAKIKELRREIEK